VPEEDGVDGAEAVLGFGEEFFGSVAAGFGIVDGAIPDEKLDLGKGALGPGAIGIQVIGFVEAELGAAFVAPGLHSGEPGGIGRIGGTRKEDFGGRGRHGEGHGAVGSDEGVAGFPFVGAESCRAGEEEYYEKCCRPERRLTRVEEHRKEGYAKKGENSAVDQRIRRESCGGIQVEVLRVPIRIETLRMTPLLIRLRNG